MNYLKREEICRLEDTYWRNETWQLMFLYEFTLVSMEKKYFSWLERDEALKSSSFKWANEIENEV